ncbi:hypothetical protein PX699_13675 [Sphingobium sp. H39-3-25]|uniref:hypothetical protein n=1 Tax=Sphingobium arseniciresistens TaxID=3030834 RepID=UPI0023B8AA52|nr:hypothetical protein [Sphingobium arseniciresistens]
MNLRKSRYSWGAVCLALVIPAHAQDQSAQQPSAFAVTANAFSNCLKRTVQMGMISKMDPAKFQEGFAKSCKTEEAQFRVEGIKEAVRQGRTETAAAQEIDGNIANGRRIFAADQESYIRTGRVPR